MNTELKKMLETYTQYPPSELLHKLVECDLLHNQCSICKNNGEWLGHRLPLDLNHINGDDCDNRLKNLRVLCPNCHNGVKNKLLKKSKKISNRDI